MYFTTFVRRKLCTPKKKIRLNHYKNLYNRIDCTKSSNKTRKVPKGYIGLYVGEERKRYEVPAKYLSLPAFQELIVQLQADELEAKFFDSWKAYFSFIFLFFFWREGLSILFLDLCLHLFSFLFIIKPSN